MISLDKILLEMYAPGFKLEDFLMSPTHNANQHLPEKAYPCKDCHFTFPSAEDFSNHFLRLVEGESPTTIIIGCKMVEAGVEAGHDGHYT